MHPNLPALSGNPPISGSKLAYELGLRRFVLLKIKAILKSTPRISTYLPLKLSRTFCMSPLSLRSNASTSTPSVKHDGTSYTDNPLLVLGSFWVEIGTGG